MLRNAAWLGVGTLVFVSIDLAYTQRVSMRRWAVARLPQDGPASWPMRAISSFSSSVAMARVMV